MSNIYATFKHRSRITARERMFVWYYIDSGDKTAAYLKAFRTQSPEHARKRSADLLTTKRIKRYMEKIREEAMREVGINDQFMLEQAKKAIEEAKGEKKVPGLTFTAGYAGLGEANKKGLPGILPRGFISSGEIPIIDVHEEPPNYPPDVEDVMDEIKVHHGDIIDENVPAQLGEGQETG